MHRRYETTKAGDAVKALKASLKPQATVCRDGKWQTIECSASGTRGSGLAGVRLTHTSRLQGKVATAHALLFHEILPLYLGLYSC